MSKNDTGVYLELQQLTLLLWGLSLFSNKLAKIFPLFWVWFGSDSFQHYIMRLFNQFSAQNGHWSSCNSRICFWGKCWWIYVYVLKLKNEVQLLLFYRLTLCRMSSDEEKSTSPVFPNDFVQDSSVSSDPQVGQRQYNLIYCHGILFGKE